MDSQVCHQEQERVRCTEGSPPISDTRPLRGAHTYCLTVRGTLMESPVGPSYSDGDIILVDPERVPKHRDRVIFRRKGEEKIELRQLWIEDGKRYLVYLNPAWQGVREEIGRHGLVVATVVGKWVLEA